VTNPWQLGICCGWDEFGQSLAVFDRDQRIALTVQDGCRHIDVPEALDTMPCDDGPRLIEHAAAGRDSLGYLAGELRSWSII
jgi:hypothetical protein